MKTKEELIRTQPGGARLLDELGTIEGDLPGDTALEIVRLYESGYAEWYVRQHPTFPSKAILALQKHYNRVRLPADGNPERITVPCSLKQYTRNEYELSILLYGAGCSVRAIAEFYRRDRSTVDRYLGPLVELMETGSEHMSDEEWGSRVKTVMDTARGVLQS